ncbi:MAG: CIA30 family protein [Myxococcota bacterium]
MAVAIAGPLDAVDRLDWRVVNDGVMGGVSSGQVSADDGVVAFRGTLSLENNGGFASIRSVPQALALEGARALRVTVRGDGRVWDLTLRRSDVPLRAGSYRVQVATTHDPVVVEVPLSAFRPTSFGRPVGGAPALDAAADRIDSIGFLLADKQPGPFALDVLAIEPVGGAEARAEGVEAVRKELEKAVAAGVPAFNEGDPERCRDLYAEVLRANVEAPALTPGERSLVREALDRAARQSATDAAWTLRRAIDSVLASA